MPLIDPARGGNVVETVQTDVADHILLQGGLESGALLSYHLRGGAPFAGQPGVIWTIYGEKGEVRITNPVTGLDITHEGLSINLHVFGEKEARPVELPKDDLSELAHPGQNVGRVYEAYASGKDGGPDGYPNWMLGLRRHELIEQIWKSADGEKPFGESVVKGEGR